MSANQYPSAFPAVPASLSAGEHGMRNSYAPEKTQRNTPHTVSNITPYLGLRSRLSQVWINRWTVLLFLILVRVSIAIIGLNHDIGSARTEAMSACKGVEDMGSAMASMPHYLSAGVNDLAASGVEKAIHGLHAMLLVTITGVEELIVFYVNMMTSTYMCLITLVVAGSLHVALQVIEDVTKFLNGTIKEIGKDLAAGIDDFQKGLNGFTKGINSIPQAFGAKEGIPTLNVTDDLTKLQNLTLPPGVDQELTKLNSSIPNFQEVQNFTDNVIRFPFEEVKKLLAGKANFTFDRNLLPVPQKEHLTFCTDHNGTHKNGLERFFDDLVDIADVARKVFTAILVILAIGVCIPMAIQEYRRWNKMKQRAELVSDKSFDPMDVIYINSRPYTATVGIKASAPFKDPKKQILTRWVVAYATSPPALVVLSLGITGLLACLCQYLLLKAVVHEVPALAHEITQFADVVVDKLNNASEAWANGTNTAIMGVNNEINHDIFGWVNITTGAINNTLNVFINETIGTLNKTFGGTVLYEPITGIFECLIGLKVASIQKGLTWVSDNAHVDFPLLNNNTFSLGAAASLANSSSHQKRDNSTAPPKNDNFLAAGTGAATDKITAAVAKVAAHLENGIRTEALISTGIVLVWLLILLMGLSRALFLALKTEKGRAEGGPSYAGDIPLENQPPMEHRYSTSGPAPAYETPQPNSAPRTFQHFAQPMGRRDEEEWRDEKLGFGGAREPSEREQAPRHESLYVEKH